MKDEVLVLVRNMPLIASYMSELSTLVNNLPKEAATDLTVTMGKSNFKLNRDKDKEIYASFVENIYKTSNDKIIKLRDMIDGLLYNDPNAEAAVKSL